MAVESDDELEAKVSLVPFVSTASTTKHVQEKEDEHDGERAWTSEVRAMFLSNLDSMLEAIEARARSDKDRRRSERRESEVAIEAANRRCGERDEQLKAIIGSSAERERELVEERDGYAQEAEALRARLASMKEKARAIAGERDESTRLLEEMQAEVKEIKKVSRAVALEDANAKLRAEIEQLHVLLAKRSKA